MISAQIYLLSEAVPPCIQGATDFLSDHVVITPSYVRCGQYCHNDSEKVSTAEQSFSKPGGVSGFLEPLASSEKQDHFCSYWTSWRLRMMKVLFP